MSEWAGEERREHPTVCLHEHEWGEVHQYIKNQELRWNEIKLVVFKHIEDGEKAGGVRDRVLILEKEISVLKQSYWKVGLSCGFLGAMIGNIAPEAIQLLIRWVTGR